MEHVHSEDEATTHSVFEYASSSSSNEDVDMIDSESDSNASFMPRQVSKRAAESDPDSSSEDRRTKRLRMTSPSSSVTTSGPSSPTSPLEQPSRPFSNVPNGFFTPYTYDDRSAHHRKPPAEDSSENRSGEVPTKRPKLNPLAKPFYPTSSPITLSKPTPYSPQAIVFDIPSWQSPLRTHQPNRPQRPAPTYGFCPEARVWDEGFSGDLPADILRRTTDKKPYDTRYSEGDLRRKEGKVLSVEDMKRILRRGGS